MIANGQQLPAEFLQWCVDMGADEAIGDTPLDRTKLPAPLSPAVKPLPALPVKEETIIPMTGAIAALGDAKILASQAQTVNELKSALENFQGLSLKRTATQIVFAEGAPTSKIMLVGEFPGADEDRAGRPFAGSSGQLLDKMLAAIGLSREENVYLTQMINWHPPGGRAPTETEITLSLPFIQRHIELVNPAILICIGGMAAKTLLQNSQNILRLRGRWIDYTTAGSQPPIPSLAFLSPAYLLASPAQKPQAWADLLMLKAKIKEMGL